MSSQLAQPHCSVPATALDPRLFLTLSSLHSLSSLPYLPFPFFLSCSLAPFGLSAFSHHLPSSSIFSSHFGPLLKFHQKQCSHSSSVPGEGLAQAQPHFAGSRHLSSHRAFSHLPPWGGVLAGEMIPGHPYSEPTKFKEYQRLQHGLYSSDWHQWH